MSNRTCPKCGNSEFGNGVLTGVVIIPEDKVFPSMGSKLTLEICTECGHIINMKVDKPNKFKK
jgi:predicted nucleic-acid-binding Zn-ribbon protein